MQPNLTAVTSSKLRHMMSLHGIIKVTLPIYVIWHHCGDIIKTAFPNYCM